jgi:hypothetical protein
LHSGGRLELTASYQRLVHLPSRAEQVTLVYKKTEKKSDVNLAADLISGAFLGHYERAQLPVKIPHTSIHRPAVWAP